MNLEPVPGGARSPRPSHPILLAQGIRKEYGSREALKGLSFSLDAGRVLGFLGPNGAGKTTAIRILTTILEPSAGRFVVDGIGSEHPERIRHKIGVLPESLGFTKSNTALEHLTYFGQLYGRSAHDARAHAHALVEEVGLQKRAKSQVGTYSRGMRQRLGIARALVNDPVVVFLDEPTLGLDPRGQKELLSLIRRIPRERHASIVLCSHLLSEIEGVCDDVVILSSGQVVANGTVSDVIRQARANFLQNAGIRIHVPSELLGKAQDVLQAMSEVEQAVPVGGMPGWLGVELAGVDHEDSRVNNQLLECLIRAEIPVLSFQAEVGRLQDAFLHLTDEAIQ